MKASDFIVKELTSNGIHKVFGYIGGMITYLVDSIYRNPDIEMINTITEQGAGFAAEGYAKLTNKPAVAIVTSGPGATNLVTPIADCYFDSVPVMFITGQVNSEEYKKFSIRQCGFQETDIVEIVKPITKYSKTITNINELKYEIQKAFYIMNSGRKGPVLLDLPIDIQRTEADWNISACFSPEQEKNTSSFDIKKVSEILNNSEKPIILAGNGINLSNTQEDLNGFLKKTGIPVIRSLHGIFPSSDEYEYNLGLIGTYGNRFANIALAEADMILVLGSRLDTRQIGSNTSIFRNKKIIQVDIDENELNCHNLDKITVQANISDFLKELNKEEYFGNISNWQKRVIELKNKYNSSSKNFQIADTFFEKLLKYLKNEDVISADVGQNQMWTAQNLSIRNKQKFITSGGLGCMGFSLPAGIGASFQSRCIVITGDGGFQMNLQELEIIKRRNLPVKIIILNNSNLGMVRAFQELYFESRFPSTVWDYSVPDFEKIIEAYGLSARTINIENITENDIKDFLDGNTPSALNIIMPVNTQVEPRLQFGNPLNKQHPVIMDTDK